MNWINILVLIPIAAYAIFCIWHIRQENKEGTNVCAGNCSSCGLAHCKKGNCNCH